MNFDLHRQAGTSSEDLEYRASAEILPPQMTAWRLRACFDAYERSGDGLYKLDEFASLVRGGHIINVVVLGPDQGGQGKDFAIFGLELMKDRDGPYTQFLFFEQQRGRLKDVAALVIWITWSVSKAYHRAESDQPFARCLLKGRDGWPRMLRRFGITIDDRGMIHENQEAFGYGNQWRQ
jgi:hypothetical protein